MLDFSAAYVGGELVSQTAETTDAQWVPRHSIMAWLTVPYLRERFAAYLEFDGSVRYLSYVTQPTFELHLERDL